MTAAEKVAFDALHPIEQRYIEIVNKKTFASDQLKEKLLSEHPPTYNYTGDTRTVNCVTKGKITSEEIDEVFKTIYPLRKEIEIDYIKSCVDRRIYFSWGDILTNLK